MKLRIRFLDYSGLIFLLLSCSVSFAQESIFGDVSKAELEMTKYSPDPTAAAVVLFNVGENKYDQLNGDMVFTSHKRIKILKKAGLNEADILIPFYNEVQKLYKIKAGVYNLEDGIVTQTLLSTKAFYNEKTSPEMTSRKFSFPNVRVGSVIEYQYTIETYDFTYIPHWTFQEYIPVAYSSFHAEIPSFLQYNLVKKGALGNLVYKFDSKPFYWPGNAFELNFYSWESRDIPAFQTEPYINSKEQQIAGIEFELSKILIESYSQIFSFKDFSPSYEVYSDRLLDKDDFGHKINLPGIFHYLMPADLDKMKTQKEKMLAIYDAVINKLTWNGEESMFAENLPGKFKVNSSYNSAAINFVLLNMLHDAGIAADPIILSTRDKGYIPPNIPIRSRLNYIVVKANIDGQFVMLDGTDPLRPAGMLPFSCMNGKGWKVLHYGEWTDLRTNESFSTIYSTFITLSDSSFTRSEASTVLDGYDALDERKIVHAIGLEQVRKLAYNTSGDRIMQNWEMQNLDSLYKPLLIKETVDYKNAVQRAGNKLIYNPFSAVPPSENPFVQEKRLYPVDFGCPVSVKYNFIIFIPKGYEVTGIPKPENYSLPNGNGRLTLQSEIQDNKIVISCSLQIKKSVFTVAEYPSLKEFFTLFSRKQSEYVVMKKKNS
jgi:Domain of Unknown Function with PDB structure (DUF3857)/Domain of Unknown Function with PDB structure (DUF3858)